MSSWIWGAEHMVGKHRREEEKEGKQIGVQYEGYGDENIRKHWIYKQICSWCWSVGKRKWRVNIMEA